MSAGARAIGPFDFVPALTSHTGLQKRMLSSENLRGNLISGDLSCIPNRGSSAGGTVHQNGNGKKGQAGRQAVLSGVPLLCTGQQLHAPNDAPIK